MRQVVIVSGVRTPMGKFNGTLKGIPAPELGALAIGGALNRSDIEPEMVDEVIMGNVVSAGLGQNVARQAAIKAGIPDEVGAFHVNKVCGSSLKSVVLAAQAIKCEDAELVIAGGMENMSRAPYLLPEARFGYRMFDGKLVDSMVHDGLWDVFGDFHMGITGENIAKRYSLTREDLDRYSLRSHKLASGAQEEGLFRDEIISVKIRGRKAEGHSFESDEGIRPDTTLEKLSRLRPAFKDDGLITAGNASQITDGAAALAVTSEDYASEHGLEILGRIEDYNTSGVSPENAMEAPIPGIRKILKNNGLSMDDIDLVEHNEAFSSASVAVSKEFDIDDSRFNVKGGAIALGHPIGCSGARIMVTLLHTMKQRKMDLGLATICLGGGNAVNMLVRRV